MKTYYEVHVKYEKLNTETGKYKKTTEQYLVNAISFGDAELKITDIMNAKLPGQFEIKADKIVNYVDVLNRFGDKFYKVKSFYIGTDDREKEKKIYENILVKAFTLKDALTYLFDDNLVSISETKIVDVFE